MFSNTFTIRPSGSGSGQYQFVVQYVGTAAIRERKYQLGIFNFHIVDNAEKVNVTLDEAHDIMYSIVDTTASKIVIQAEKNGVMETLELKGGQVLAVGLNSFTIFVN